MTLFRVFKVFLTAAAVALAALFLSVVVFDYWVTRDLRWDEERGPVPIERATIMVKADRAKEVYVTTVASTTLADLADMSLFGGATPGLTPEDFEARHGTARLQTAASTVTPFRERQTSPLAGTIEWQVLHATPTQELAVDRVFRPAIAQLLRRLALTGTVHIHNGSSTGFLTCRIVDGKRVTHLRWHGAA